MSIRLLSRSFPSNVLFSIPFLCVLFQIQAQTPLHNPDLIATCPYNIIFVLDESGSIVGSSNGTSNISALVRSGAGDLITALNGTGSNVAVAEFNTNARLAVIGGSTSYQVINSAYVAAFNSYITRDNNTTPSDANYDPEDYSCPGNQCYTNWESAFNLIENINATMGRADLVIFFTDGMPTAYIDPAGTVVIGTNSATVAQALSEATVAANAVKLQGSHIFVVGIPNPNLPEFNIRQISGPDKYPNPESDFSKGDYSVSSSSTLQNDLSGIANSVCIVDLRLEKTVDKPLACVGEMVVFTLALYNEGADNASSIIVQDVIPSGYTYVSDNGDAATTEAGGTVAWSVGSLARGASVSIEITAIVNATGNYRNTAQVTVCPQTDADSSPNNDDGDQSEDDEAFAIVSVTSPQICDDHNPCSSDQCISGECSYTFLNCDDGDACTLDECIGNSCIHTPLSFNITIEATICDNEFYFAGGALQNTSGIFTDTFTTATGCDSIQTTVLTVLPTYRRLIRVPICQGDSIYAGGYYRKEAGVYNDSFIAGNGCDSIFTTAVVIPNCNDFNPCTDDFCIEGLCDNLPKDCDDHIHCTADACTGGACFNTDTCMITLSGYLLSESGAGIPGATVQLTGTENATAITGADGYYEFSVPSGGTYTITPSKNNDVNVINGISTVDMALTTFHILSVQLLSSPYRIIAADVNESGTVSTLDVALMTGLVLGNTSTFPNGRLWEFVSSDDVFPDTQHPFPFDERRTYNNLTQSLPNQNFIGVKLGDVNNSWNPGVP